MNKLEKFVYDYLKHHPALKMKVRNIYLDIMDILPDYPSWFDGELIVKEGYFFGFHDQTPFSYNDDFILSHKLVIPLRVPLPKDPLIVGFWNKDFSEFEKIDTSYAWNYHKGCRLQWVNKDKYSFIFNTSIKEKLCSKIWNINDRSFKVIDSPIDSVSPCGKLATSFSYERLEKFMPGYGYHYGDDSFISNSSPDKTGLYIVDLEKNISTMICTIDQISKIDQSASSKKGRHYFTHTLFSPDSKRVAFLHRWVFDDDMAKRVSRLISCNIDGSDIKVAPTTGMVSHYVWDEKNGLLAYCRINDIDGHYLFKDSNFTNPKGLAINFLNSDGHQHFIPNTHSFVTDTYPNQRRYAKLYIVNTATEEVKLIADGKSLKKFQTRRLSKHWGCDLHPRVNHKGDTVCFDSTHTGSRSLCFLKFKSD